MTTTTSDANVRVALIGGPDVDARLPLMQRLASSGFELQAIGSSPELAAVFSEHGFTYRDYPLNRRVAPFADLRSVRRLRAVLQQLRPQIVHTFDTKPGVWGAIAARRAGVPVVVSTVTGLGSLYATPGLKARVLRAVYELLQKQACRRADLTVFQNHDDRDQLVAAGIVDPERTDVILGSGVETDRYAPERVPAAQRDALRRELGLPADAVVVTMISRVTRAKGVLELEQAARALQGSHPQVRFLLIGPDDVDSIDRLGEAERRALREVITWPGPRRDVPVVLAASDVVVLPTAYREGVPRVLLEAASMGLPLITTDSPGCNEVVVDGDNGVLIPPGDGRALAAAVVRLADDAALRQEWGQRSRRRAVEQFDLAVVAARTEAVYRQLLQRVGVGA